MPEEGTDGCPSSSCKELITIFAHGAFSGERLAEVSVRTSDTVADLKAAVQEATGHKQLQLLSSGRPLAGDETLEGVALGDGSSVGVVVKRTPLVATGSADFTARIWDTDTGECNHLLHGHKRSLNSVAFSPGGVHLASASSDWTAKIWCAESGACRATLEGHAHYVHSAAFSGDGALLATGAAEACTSPSQMRHQKGAAWIWDVEQSSCTMKLEGHDGYVNSAVFSKDGRLLLTASNDKMARLWDLTYGQCARTFIGHTDYVTSAVFSPDGRSLATASDDKTAKTWEMAAEKQCSQTFQGHDAEVRSVAYSPDGACLATASKDRTARLWFTVSGFCRRTLRGHRGGLHSAGFSPGGGEVVTSSMDRTARIWDVEKAACLLVLKGHENHVFSACFPHW